MPERPEPAAPTTTAAASAVAQSRTGGAAAADSSPNGGSPNGEAPNGGPPNGVVPDGAAGFAVGDGVARGARAAAYERRADDPIYRPLWIYTTDPSASRYEGATAIVNVPFEPLDPGPVGALFKVVPVDPSTGDRWTVLEPDRVDVLLGSGRPPSPADPRFHQQMVYAVCSAVYAAFRRALGRQITWGFDRGPGADMSPGADTGPGADGHRLVVYPHGGEARNAWYDPAQGALRFGYYRADDDATGRNVPGGFVFTCLSHDIVAHEVTHALLDGLRAHFTLPTSPDVLGFHEGFADLVAILQHFSYPEVVRAGIAASRGSLTQTELLTGLARQFGHTTGANHPLRTAVTVDARGEVVPRPYRADAEAHEMGSVLVSAVFDAFLAVYRRKTARYVRLATGGTGVLPGHEIPADLQGVLAHEASQLASQFLAICIRAIDFCPPVDLELGEYLRALITADLDLVPDDPWGYREALIESFGRHRIFPPQVRSLAEDELRWQAPEAAIEPVAALTFAKLQFRGDPACASDAHELARQADAVGRLVSGHLGHFGMIAPGDAPRGDRVDPPRVQSVRSCRRVGPDGQVVFDLVAEVTQRRVVADAGGEVAVYGGATVLIGPQGEVRYVVAKHVLNARRTERQCNFVRGAGRALWRDAGGGRLAPRADLFQLLHD